MKIAIATPILYDPTSPFNHLFKDIIGGFLDAGYEVIRLVAVKDRIEDGYKYGFENVEYKTYSRKESAHGNIVSRYIRDNLACIRESIGIRESGADVLFEDVSYASFWAVKAAKRKGMRVVAMLQDVWPDNAVQSGLIRRNGVMYRYFEALQKHVYKHADKIICISEDMKEFIISKGIEESRIEVIYNWGYTDDKVSIPWEENEFVKKYSLERDFYAVYAGNIGKMQNVELVVRAAKKMPDTKFLIIGDGAKREEITKMAEEVKNVKMLPLQPPELAEHIYSMAGVNIIPLVEGGPKTAMPSKTGVILSCGRPVIFCFGSESRFAEQVEEYGAGACVSATDENELVRAIARQRMEKEGNIGASQLFNELFTRTRNIGMYVKAVQI